MTKIVEDKNDDFLSLMGKRVTLFCANYFYTGILAGVNRTQVLLHEPSIVYETGAWTEGSKWADAQRLPTESLYVRIPAIESYCELKKG